jgi:RecB family endonuclease NucS
LQQYLSSRAYELEQSLTLIDGGVEYSTEVGRIDVLKKYVPDSLVVIELKAGKANDSAINQLLGYIGCLSQDKKF